MSHAQSTDKTEELGDIFVAVTGNESVTQEQEKDNNDRELRGESHIDEAVADGLDDALEGAEAESGDPG